MPTEIEEPRPAARAPKQTGSRPAPGRHANWNDEEPEVSGFKKWRVPIIAGVLLATGIGFVAKTMSKKSAAPPPKQDMTVVRIVAPPPPPPVATPPPPQQIEEKKEEMVEEVKQEEAQPEPAPQVETALKGAGNTGMVLKAGNGSGIFSNRPTVSAERMRWSAYAGQVKSRISQALEANPKTRKAVMRIDVRVWPDATGRVVRASLASSTGDSALDAIIRDEVLTGLEVSQPPPAGMPLPIVLRITARKQG